MQKLKILLTIPNFDTAGSGKALLNIATRLDPTRFDVQIMCKHSKGDFFKVVEASGLKVHVVDYETPMRPIGKALLGVWSVSRKLKRINPDIIHSFHYSSDYSEALAARFAGIKFIYTKKNMNWGGPSKNSWFLRTLLANHICVQNTDMFAFFEGFSKSKFTLLPRGVNTIEFTSNDRSKSEICQKLELSDNFRYVICVANLVPVKGVETLIEAFNISNADGWHLLIVGDNNSEYGSHIKGLVKQKGMTSKVTFTGKTPLVKDYLEVSELFVLPTKNEGRREGSPVSLLEAMSMGLYVLGSKIPGIKDQLSNFPELMFEAGNVQELSGKMEMVFNLSQIELKTWSAILTEHVLNNYSIEKEVKNHQEIYDRVF